DVDSNVSVTLSVDHGTLNATGASGNGTNTLTIASGTPAAVNAILATLTYQGTLNFNGADTLKITTSDGTLSDTDNVAIAVTPVNDAPTTAANAVTTAENTTYTFKLSDFPFADVDTGDSLATVRIATLPAAGTGVVQLDGVNIAANATFTAAQIAGGHLTF